MHIPSTFASALGAPASAALGFLGRLAAVPLPAVPSPVMGRAGDGVLTPGRVRAVLLEMGAAAADADVALAAMLAAAGLPLTASALAEAHGALAGAPRATPTALVLAKTLGLPATPDVLTALTAVLRASGTPLGTLDFAEPALADLLGDLGLAVEAGDDPARQARGLREMALHLGQSTERRLATQGHGVADLRTALLRLSVGTNEPGLRHAADGLARLVEGQQLLNQAALTQPPAHTGSALYLAFPLAFGGLYSTAEARVWLPAPEARDEGGSEAPALRVTLRVTPPRLGRVQADLCGHLSGTLSCRLGAERPASARLLTRHTGGLAAMLAHAGWPSCDVSCRAQAAWPPLWPGAGAVTTPRASVDRHA
jgi:hypothetical protein